MIDSMFETLERRQLLAVNISVNAAARFQQIDGFGTTMAWWVPGLYDDAWSSAYYKDLGSSMLRMDLNLNALLGSDGDATTPVTMGEDLQSDINAFDWNAVVLQRFGDVAKAAATKKIDSFKLFATISSPPQWMKGEERNADTGVPNGKQPVLTTNTTWGYPIYDSCGGSLIDTPDNLQQFGRYVAAYVKGIEQHFGTPVYALSLQNELAFREPYNSSVYDPALYVKTIKAVADAFHHYGITTKIMGPEDVGVGSTSNPWVLKRQMKYIDAVRADPVAMKDLDMYAIHGYADDGITANRSPAMWSQYWNGRPASQYPNPAGANWVGIKGDGKKSWMTEAGGEPPTWDGALRLAANANDGLVQGNVNAWVYWQMSESPTTPSNQAMTIAADTTAPKYVAAKHFFRYIRPGAVRVSATPSDPSGVYTSAFVHDANKTLTEVLINLGMTPQTVNLTLSGVSVSTFNIARQSSAAGLWKDLGPIAVHSGVATITLPARSIVTLQGATSPPPVATGSISGNLWNDMDGDGVRDAGESGLANWKVWLDTDKDGVLDAGEKTALTDSSGNYRFSGLAAGTYCVRQVLPSGWRRTSLAVSYNLALATGAASINKNFGDTQKILIAGSVFNDINSNGIRDTGETGLSAWRVFIDTDNDGVLDTGERSVLTDASGSWSFKDLSAGTYRVRVAQQTGWKRTRPASGYYLTTLSAGAMSSGETFGEKKIA